MHFCQRCKPMAELEPSGQTAVCPECGWAEPARREPLFVVTGASGSGKTGIFGPLARALPECVVFDVDYLIDPMKHDGDIDWGAFRDAWLSVAHGVAQGRRSTVLLGPFLPEQLEPLPARRWIGPIHFAVLDCDDDTRRARLAARPSWREQNVGQQLGFAAHLRTSIGTIVDTSSDMPEQSAHRIAGWARAQLHRRSEEHSEHPRHV